MMRRRDIVFGLALCAAAPSPARAGEEPLAVMREILARAQKGERLSDMIAAQNAADLFVKTPNPRVVSPPDFDPLAGRAGAPTPRILATRTLRRARDTAQIQVALRERGRKGRTWSVFFVLQRVGAVWRVESVEATFDRAWLSRIAPRL
jgi:hypothetical protein